MSKESLVPAKNRKRERESNISRRCTRIPLQRGRPPQKEEQVMIEKYEEMAMCYKNSNN